MGDIVTLLKPCLFVSSQTSNLSDGLWGLLLYEGDVTSTIEGVRARLDARTLYIYKLEQTPEFYVELFNDVIPTMPHLRALHIVDTDIDEDVHAMCARLVATNNNITAFSTPNENVQSFPSSIEALYARAVRRRSKDSPLKVLNLYAHNYDYLHNLSEVLDRYAPTMLENCHDALVLTEKQLPLPTQH